MQRPWTRTPGVAPAMVCAGLALFAYAFHAIATDGAHGTTLHYYLLAVGAFLGVLGQSGLERR